MIFLANHAPLNQRVPGSSPGAPTRQIEHLQMMVNVSFRHAESAAVTTVALIAQRDAFQHVRLKRHVLRDHSGLIAKA